MIYYILHFFYQHQNIVKTLPNPNHRVYFGLHNKLNPYPPLLLYQAVLAHRLPAGEVGILLFVLFLHFFQESVK